jgi:hypothetical protein
MKECLRYPGLCIKSPRSILTALTTSFQKSGQHPGVNNEHSPFFGGMGDQDLSKQPLYYLTNSTLELGNNPLENQAHWLHTKICNVGLHPLRAKHSPSSGEPVLHEIPDL